MGDRGKRKSYKICIGWYVLVWSTVLFISSGCTHFHPVAKQPVPEAFQVSPEAVNINTASKEELQRLPYVGTVVADRIIEFRSTHGPFRRPESLMLIKGVSDARFRRIRHLIRTE